ncbi:MAG: YncE family protein [Segetibacter sp.]|nr:YncE family protein [Segetibacter sp.]
MIKPIFAFVISICAIVVPANSQSSHYKISKTFHIASAGGWDYLAVNGDKLYVSHGGQVNILDKKTGDSLGVIENTTGVHGIAFVPALNKGYTSNGRLNNVTVFDLKTDKVLGQIPTGQNPDAIMYDNYSKKIITCNGRSNDVTVIDPVTGKIVSTIAVGGKPETAVSDDAGKLFVNVEDKNEIVEIDTKTFKAESHWSIAPAEGPTGLAIDTKTHRLFAGCDKLLAIINSTDGKLVSKLPIGDGCDGVAFDPATKNVYTSNGEGTMTVIHESDANNFKVLENVKTKPRARTIALDTNTHKVYLPTAEFEPLASNAAKGERPKMIPGTFQVLVIEK